MKCEGQRGILLTQPTDIGLRRRCECDSPLNHFLTQIEPAQPVAPTVKLNTAEECALGDIGNMMAIRYEGDIMALGNS